MRLTTLAAVTFAFAGCATVSTDDVRATAEVATADRQFNRALERSDVAALSKLIADDYLFTDPAGGVSGKSDVLNGFASGRIRIQSQTTSEVTINVFGDNAVETGLLTSKAMRDGRNSGGVFRFTRVWVKKDGSWRTAAFQETALQRQP